MKHVIFPEAAVPHEILNRLCQVLSSNSKTCCLGKVCAVFVRVASMHLLSSSSCFACNAHVAQLCSIFSSSSASSSSELSSSAGPLHVWLLLLYHVQSEERDFSAHLAQASPGAFVLFPGWLEHFVKPHSTNEPRISISFNSKATHQQSRFGEGWLHLVKTGQLKRSESCELWIPRRHKPTC